MCLKPADRLTIAEAMTQADEKLYEVKKHRIKEVAKKNNFSAGISCVTI